MTQATTNRARAAVAAATSGADPTKAVAQADGKDVERAPATMAAVLDQMGPQFARALPDHIPAERFIRLALTAVKQNPGLARCTQDSFLGALMTCAQLGLEPNTPLGEAYLIPYGNECTFQPGYQGLVKLAWQSGVVTNVFAEVIRERDVWSVRYGLNPDLTHEPARGDRGEPIGYYAVVKLRDADPQFVHMTADEIAEHEKKYVKRKSKAIDSDWMQKKTPLKQVLKLIPKSSRLAVALQQDGAVRTSLNLDAIDTAPQFPSEQQHEVIEGQVVDTETGEVTPTDEDIAAMNAEAAADPQNQGK